MNGLQTMDVLQALRSLGAPTKVILLEGNGRHPPLHLQRVTGVRPVQLTFQN